MTEILYYDRDICVCNKPRGTLSEGEGSGALPSLLAEELAKRGETCKIYPVHRLDKETTGLIVYALNSKAAAELSSQIVNGRLKKEYIAEICGSPSDKSGELTDLLFYDRQRGRSYVVDRVRKGVKEARLSYTVLEERDGISRVRVKLYTGRTHQIRVQFASRKMPLVGDRRYGAPATDREMSLVSCYLEFEHPRTKEPMVFEL